MTRADFLEALDDPSLTKFLNRRSKAAFWFAFLRNSHYLAFAKIVYLCGLLDGLQLKEDAK